MLQAEGEQAGGFINDVVIRNNKLYKRYSSEKSNVVALPGRERFSREVSALKIFGGDLAPILFRKFPGALVAVMSVLPGINSKLAIENGLSEPKERELYFQLGKALREIHSRLAIGVSPQNYIFRTEGKARKDMFLLLQSQVPELVGLSMRKLDTILGNEVLPRVRETILSYGQLVCTHGDYSTGNTMAEISGRRSPRLKVFDWEYATAGVPEEDLAQVCLWELTSRPEMAEPFEDGYGKKIDAKRIAPFRILKLLDYLEGISKAKFRAEAGNSKGFLSVNLALLKAEIAGWSK